MYRIGIDVGGTNTDAVVLKGQQVVESVKLPTTEDVITGVTSALAVVMAKGAITANSVSAVMIGTTHFLNALIEGNGLNKVAVLRLCGKATASLPPMVDWPPALREQVSGYVSALPGGAEYDGAPIAELDVAKLKEACRDIRELGLTSIAISSVFAPVKADDEKRARDIVMSEIPGARVSLSHEVGRLGLLARESACILNASLHKLGKKTLSALSQALLKLELNCPLYLTQNDGTLMSAAHAERFPIFTLASGPTNSMRGAAFLSGLKNAIVIDIGGTTSDIGLLVEGFPRERVQGAEIAGVRTNFKMPDVLSVGLGGGSIVNSAGDDLSIGPVSVGFRLQQEARIFGGDTLTATDIAVAHGLLVLGNPATLGDLSPALVERAVDRMQDMLSAGIERMKPGKQDIPVILTGGGSVLVKGELIGNCRVIRPPHYASANAVGAAIAQISGEVDRIFSVERDQRASALEAAKTEARQKAVAAGAKPDTVDIVEVDETPLAYLPNNATRIRVKAIGELLA